jgi:hypothetical protein
LNITKYILFSSFIIAIFGCANPQPPSGGPRDKTPPVVVGSQPPNNTINYQKNEVSLEFNKYMDKNKVIESILLSPSKRLKYNWSGKTLDIKIDELMDTNTTYSLILGTEYTDYLQNKPTDAFTLTFSTGSHLDSGKIIGHLFDDNPSGIYIYGYLLNGLNPDTLNIAQKKPNYLTQVGTSGNFELKSLKNGNYRIFAIRDPQKKGIYIEGADAFGSAPNDVIVKSNLIPFVQLKIGPPIDKSGPMLYSAEGLTNRLIEANFSEDIDALSIYNKSFKITDSAATTEIPVISAYPSELSPKNVKIIAGNELEKGKKYKLIVNLDSAFVVKDTIGNHVRDTARTCYFFSNGEKDTTTINLIKAPLKDSSQNIDPNTSFEYLFNSSLDNNNIEGRIELKDLQNGKSVELSKDFRTGNRIVIHPNKKLESISWYELSFKFDSLKAFTGIMTKDSTLRLHFKTSDIRNYSSASGILKNYDSCPGKTALILISKDTKLRIKATLTDSNKWEASDIPSGNYDFEVYCDKNGNGKFDFGYPFPFRFAEPFAFIKNDLNIPPRWRVENIVVIVK